MLRRLAPFLADLWQHRELFWQFSLRNIELRHKGSHLGLIWSFLSPLLMLGLYVLVFGFINRGRFGVLPNETWIDYGLGIFMGLTLFHFISEILSISPGIIVSNPNLVKKVVFPLEILPAARVGAAVFHFLISLGLVLLGLALSSHGLQPGLLWLPLVILPIVLLGLGIAWLIAALGVFLRDIGPIVQFLSLALMFASAVFYPASKIPPEIWTYLRFNPLLLAIEILRDIALWQRPFNPHHLAYLWVCSVLACYLGHACFKKMKAGFADVL
jgi:lipopolysaccharide transport system permease protein